MCVGRAIGVFKFGSDKNRTIYVAPYSDLKKEIMLDALEAYLAGNLMGLEYAPEDGF
ncbi:MAG: hypothetical protein H0X30_11880 [Anaerolineae bacterium]|nr:hypothetical protein [Anaerolineae bacterium]